MHRADSALYPIVDFVPFADSPFDITDTGSTDIEESEPHLLPEGFTLYQNYPNPFNSSTSIKFEVPQAGRITLAVYNTIGQKIAVPADGYYRAGTYRVDWDGRDDRGREASSGVYFYGLSTNDSAQFKKMILLR